MSVTIVEPGLEEKQDTGSRDPDWEAWLAMDIPCVVEGCEEKVAWLGNQHGCLRAFSCDPHTIRFVTFIRADISRQGYTVCNYCKRSFDTLEAFFKAVRI